MSEAELKNTVVYVVSGWDPKRNNDRVKKLVSLGSRFDKMVLVGKGKKNSSEDGMVVRSWPNPTGILRLLGMAELGDRLDKYMLFPSRDILFIMPVKQKLARAIANDLLRGKKVCLVTVAPPHELCMLGLYIKNRYPSVRWIMDWQDLWSYDDNYYYRVPALYRERLKKVERTAFDTADMNVTTNEFAKEVLTEHYGVLPARVRAIHHHFHREDLDNTTCSQSKLEVTENRRLRVGFLGTLFKPPRVPGYELLSAIEDYRQSGLDVEVHVHGLVPESLRGMESELRQRGLFMHGFLSHKESIGMLSQYDYLLLLLADLPNSRAVMSIKLPHYLAVERPILAIVPEPSAIANIVNKTGAGFVLPVSGDWRASLKEILLSGSLGGFQPNRDEVMIEKFSWDNVSTEWIDMLAAVGDGA